MPIRSLEALSWERSGCIVTASPKDTSTKVPPLIGVPAGAVVGACWLAGAAEGAAVGLVETTDDGVGWQARRPVVSATVNKGRRSPRARLPRKSMLILRPCFEL